MSDEEYLRMQREMFYDREFDAALGALEAEAEGGGGLGGLGDLGGADDFGGEAEEGLESDLEDVMAGDEGGTPDEGGESPLLAAPANREMTTTPRSHGWYKPEKSDSRGIGARKRSYHGSYNRETGVNTPRNIRPGKSALDSLGRGIYEGVDTNYGVDEEKRLFEVNHEIKKLISDLEKKTNEK
jgi:hypothetical protein